MRQAVGGVQRNMIRVFLGVFRLINSKFKCEATFDHAATIVYRTVFAVATDLIEYNY